MAGRMIGSIVGVAFGLVYVLVNSSALPAVVRLPLQAAAVLVALGVVATALRSAKSDDPGSTPDGRAGPGRAYWTVVGLEVVALWGGLVVLNRFFDVPHVGVAWVSLVVGLHFFALAPVLQESFFNALGVAITVCGAVAFVLAWRDAPEVAVEVVGGVLPGVCLLASGCWGVSRHAAAATGHRTV